MKNTNLTTNHIMTGTTKQSLAAARSLLMNETLVSLLIEEQIKELSIIRKQHPTLQRVKAIEVALLNAAFKLKQNQHTETFCLAKVQKVKKSPQLEWLKLHKSFVLDLANKKASLREIESAIFYRFHHKVSHTKIAEFLKIEGGQNV